MADERKPHPTTILGWLQLASMVVGFGGVIYALGEKGAQLEAATRDMDKLATTVHDLAKAANSGSVADATHFRALEEIQRRLDAIERRVERNP